MKAPSKQHLIDPEICTGCFSCLAVCPESAIVEENRQLAIDPDLCRGCEACLDECPSGAIHNWRDVSGRSFFTLEEQFSWDRLP